MPNQPKTPLRNVRVEAELWSSALAKARAEDHSLSDVIRQLLREWLAT